MLTLAEEVLILAHDEQRGRLLDLPDMLLHTALAGTALLGRIDTDLAELILVDAMPTGEPLLDRPLARIARPSRTAGARPTGSTGSVPMARRSGPQRWSG